MSEQLTPNAEEIDQLQEQAENYVEKIMDLDFNSLQHRKEVLTSIDELGQELLETSAKKNKLLQNSVGELSQRGKRNGEVASSLVELESKIKELDPDKVDFNSSSWWAKIFDPRQAYFSQYQAADEEISSIILSLKQGQAALENDNITLEIEEAAIRKLTKQLKKEMELGIIMDEKITEQLKIIKVEEPQSAKIKFVQKEILFPLRQKIMDLEQMMAVNQQGIMAIEIVRRNNQKLIRGVERAVNVTVSALRIAALTASALYNQEIILNNIQSLTETSNELSAEDTDLSFEKLKTTFRDLKSVLGKISTYKEEVVTEIEKEIREFENLVE